MSFWASSFSFPLDRFTAAYRSCSQWSGAGLYYYDCKETRAMFSQGL
jgi:hypothetical protein